MSATKSPGPIGPTPTARALRFGFEAAPQAAGEPSVQWVLKRNCSMAPRQLLGFYLSLCLLSVVIAAVFWMLGATLVAPFAGAELLGLGVAMLLYAQHASDSECIRLQQGRLTVEHACGHHTDRVEFAPAWVRVEPEHGDRSLIELSGQGQRIAVGRFVRPELRRQLADELRWALRRWQSSQMPSAL
jgi:uncharacterized membrane protein